VAAIQIYRVAWLAFSGGSFMILVRMILALGLLSVAISAQAQDWPRDRHRGSMPTPSREILTALNSAPLQSDDVLVVSTRLACTNLSGSSSPAAQKIVSRYFAGYYDHYEEAAVLGRLAIGPGFLGYLLESPGMYSLSVIDLWVYDSNHASWLKPMELSEDWGDAGDYYYSDSLLTDVNHDGYKDIVKRGKNGVLQMGDEPARVMFDVTVLRTFVRTGFRDAGTPPQHLRDKLLAMDNGVGCR
jgi:hypothetical protein